MTQTPENGLTLEGVADDLETVKSVMFTLARQYERIDHTLDRSASQQEVNTQAITQVNQGIAQMTQVIAQLAETSTQQWQVTQQVLAEIREMQAEVRGLQVENRRILERVFGAEEE
jgi:methyl-accepting chemotaxis protein